MSGRFEFTLNGNDWKLHESLPNEWRTQQLWAQKPEEYIWIKATVPGCVQNDLEEQGIIPNWRKDFNSRACEWTSDRNWIYMKDFTPPREMYGKTVKLRFEGIDYSAVIYLNGKALGAHTGMYIPAEFDVTKSLNYNEKNRLLVCIEKAPDEYGQVGWTSKVKHWKARFAYSWDWCTRLIPLGIWDDVKLIATGQPYIKDARIRTDLSADFKKADIFFDVQTHSDKQAVASIKVDININGKLMGKSECSFNSGINVTEIVGPIQIENPNLWYPNGYGGQPLYTAHITVLDEKGNLTDERSFNFGIRHVTAAQNEGAPKNALPYTILVNGKKIFIKGWNWVPQDQLYGREASARYKKLLSYAKEAHCNLLRVWGGGLLEKEVFYDLCDRMGIMVWQEFIQSSSGIDNFPPTNPGYLSMIDRTSRAMIPRRRNHPSLVIWCGGNELFYEEDRKPVDNTDPAIAVLKKAVDELDPTRIFLPSSASGPTENAHPSLKGKMHDVHGPWTYQGVEEQYYYFNEIDPLFHSEFGVDGSANLETLKKYISPKLLWPPTKHNPIWVHRGSWWINFPHIEKIFGKIKDIKTYVVLSQFIQCEGLRYAVEANRRRKWRCSGTILWQFNESWPNTSCTNCIDYDIKPKPAYYAVKKAFEPLHISAKYEKLAWKLGENFNAEIWINNSYEAKNNLRLAIEVRDLLNPKKVFISEEKEVEAAENSSAKICNFAFNIDPKCVNNFVLHLKLFGKGGKKPLSNNPYVFFTKPQPVTSKMLKALKNIFGKQEETL